MSNVSISNLPSVTSAQASSQVPAVQNGTTVYVTVDQIAKYTQQTYPITGITSITAQSPLSGGTITSSGTIGLTTGNLTNNYLANMPSNTIKGNNTGSSATPIDLTVAQTMSLLKAAPLASPAFTGVPTAPTPATNDASTTIATTQYVKSQGYGPGSVTSITAGAGLNGGTITTSGTISLPTTGVNAGTYGSSAIAPVITVDTYGRLTAVTTANITPDTIGAVPVTRTVTGASGISGGGALSSNLTLSLSPIATNTVLANIVGTSSAPLATTPTALFDSAFGSTQGNILFRGASTWQVLSPGTNGQVLQTGGPSANPSWLTVTGAGTVTSIGAGTGLSSSSTNPITAAGTLSISNTGVTAGSYGSSTAIPTFTVNAQGQLTAASTAAVIAPAGTLTGTTLASNVVSSSLTSVGTIATGVWNGTTIATGYGGTGLTTFTSGGAVYATSSSALTTGTLPITSGGTGQTTASAAFNALSPITSTGDLIIGNGTNSATRLAIGTNGYVLTSNGTTASWAAASGVTSFTAGTTGFTPSSATTGAITLAGTLVAANGGTGLSSYTTGDLLYASSTTAIGKLSDVATGSVLVSGGVGVAPAWSASPTVTTINYTTAVGVTSETVPLVIGGTTASSTLTLESTSGSGTTDAILFKTGSQSERMRIDSSGNVGIGTSSPTLKLSVSGSLAVSTQVVAGATTVYSDGTIGTPSLQWNANSGTRVGAVSIADTTSNLEHWVLRNPNGNVASISTSGTSFVFNTVATERMRIDSSGNVGIGTSSPNASAILDAQSTTKGVRFPNMTTTQKNAISSPAAGLVVFDTTLAKLCVYSGSAWQTITSV